MLFGYDADIKSQLATNLVRIKDLAQNLLSSLVIERQQDYVCPFREIVESGVCSGEADLTVFLQEKTRPLIVVGHSLGGLVIKKAS